MDQFAALGGAHRRTSSASSASSSSASDVFYSPKSSPKSSPVSSPSRSGRQYDMGQNRERSGSPLKNSSSGWDFDSSSSPEGSQISDKENAENAVPTVVRLAPRLEAVDSRGTSTQSRVSLGELDIESLAKDTARLSVKSKLPVPVLLSRGNTPRTSSGSPAVAVAKEDDDSPVFLRRTKKRAVVESDDEDAALQATETNLADFDNNVADFDSKDSFSSSNPEDAENQPPSILSAFDRPSNPSPPDSPLEPLESFWSTNPSNSNSADSQSPAFSPRHKENDDPSPVFLRSAKSTRKFVVEDSSDEDTENQPTDRIGGSPTPIRHPQPDSDEESPIFTTSRSLRTRPNLLFSSSPETSPTKPDPTESEESEDSGSPTERLSPVRRGMLVDVIAESSDESESELETESGGEDESLGSRDTESGSGSASGGSKEYEPSGDESGTESDDEGEEEKVEEENPVIVFEGSTGKRPSKLPQPSPKLPQPSPLPKSALTPPSQPPSGPPSASKLPVPTRKPPLPPSTPSARGPFLIEDSDDDIWTPKKSPAGLQRESPVGSRIPVPSSPGIRNKMPASPGGVGSPRTKLPIAPGTPRSRTVAPSPLAQPSPRGPGPSSVPGTPAAKTQFKKDRTSIARDLYKEFNRRVFDARLPEDMTIEWSNKLNTTAGRCHTKRERQGFSDWAYSARIELSTKVLDDLPKLRSTLIHEMCHAATWLLDKVDRPPHGKEFKRWGAKCERVYPDIEVATCHAYEIEYRFRWRCSNDGCGKIYGRHSKSIDPSIHACGACHSRLVFIEKLKKDGTPFKPRTLSKFQVYMTANFAKIKAEMAGRPHGDVMKVVGERYRAEQAALGSLGSQDGGEEDVDELEAVMGGMSIAMDVEDDDE